MDDDENDGIEIDGALVLFDDEYDIVGASDFLIAQATELASDGSDGQDETSRRVLRTFLAAAVQCAHGRGLSEEEFGDEIVAAWAEFEEAMPEGETLN